MPNLSLPRKIELKDLPALGLVTKHLNWRHNQLFLRMGRYVQAEDEKERILFNIEKVHFIEEKSVDKIFLQRPNKLSDVNYLRISAFWENICILCGYVLLTAI